MLKADNFHVAVSESFVDASTGSGLAFVLQTVRGQN